MYSPTQRETAYNLYNLWCPTRVFDLGCGIGGYLEGFVNCGCTVAGCELNYEQAVEHMNPIIQSRTFKYDVGKPFPLFTELKYDLTMSIEVAEHLEEAKADNYCKNLVDCTSNIILLTAADKNQPGKHHVNCQPQSYWIDKIERLGIRYSGRETGRAIDVIDRLDDPLGICKNLMVFKI